MSCKGPQNVFLSSKKKRTDDAFEISRAEFGMEVDGFAFGQGGQSAMAKAIAFYTNRDEMLPHVTAKRRLVFSSRREQVQNIC